MLKAIFNWFGHKNPSPEAQAPAVQPEAAPYKVEAPVAVKPVAEPAPVAEAAPYKVPESAATTAIPLVAAVPERAKGANGKFVADNPATPENEAWVGGQAPAKKPAAIKAAKKPAAKKPATKRAPKKTS